MFALVLYFEEKKKGKTAAALFSLIELEPALLTAVTTLLLRTFFFLFSVNSTLTVAV